MSIDHLKIGQTIPEFNVPSTQTDSFTQVNLLNHYTVLYFYPKDNTPGCTQEGIDFTALLPEFEQLNTQVIGVSKDSLTKHKNFQTKHSIELELISDEEGTLCDLFGVFKLKKNYGREYMGIERSTFIIDPNGVLIHEWRKVRVKEHAQQVLSTLMEQRSL